jgi:ankyrin repeat protein
MLVKLDLPAVFPILGTMIMKNYTFLGILLLFVTACGSVSIPQRYTNDSMGRTPLIYAILENDEDRMYSFAAYFPKTVDKSDNTGNRPLGYALANTKNEFAWMLMRRKNVALNHTDNNGQNYLHKAALGNAHEVVGFLKIKGAFMNNSDKLGFAPLHYAVLRDARKTTESLLRNEANMYVRNADGDTPLHLALKSLSENTRIDTTRLQLPSEKSNVEISRSIWEITKNWAAGVDDAVMEWINGIPKWIWPPPELNRPDEERALYYLRLFEEYEFNFNTVNASGQTLMDLALLTKKAGILNYFMERELIEEQRVKALLDE